MILRLIVAFTRWIWGVSPAFVKADSGDWYMAMFFGVVIDIAVTGALAIALVDWMQSRKSR